MLIITIHNDGTGIEGVCHYDCQVSVTTSQTSLKQIATARLEDHPVGDGWRVLLHRLADEAKDYTISDYVADVAAAFDAFDPLTEEDAKK